MYLITRIPNLIQFQGDFTELRDYQIIIFFCRNEFSMVKR